MTTPVKGTVINRVDNVFMEKLIGEPISSVKIKSFGSKKGDNVAASLKSVQVTTKSGSIHNLVCKCPPEQNPSFLSYIVNCKIMDVENEFYSRVLVDLQKLVEESGNFPHSLPFPRYFGGSGQFLMLEDLRPQGYKMADKYIGLSFLETSMVLEAVAQHHALSYRLIKLEGEKYFERNETTRLFIQNPWESKFLDEEGRKNNFEWFLTVIQVMKEEIDEELANVLAGLIPKHAELFPGIYNGTDIKYFPVMCLGDLWLNNILFKYKDQSQNQSQVPVDMKFIDFQQSHRGNIYEDLHYFIFTSTTPALRKVHLPRLLQIYYDSFVKTLNLMKCPLPIGFTQGFFVDHFYKNLINFSVFVGGAIAFHLGEHPEEFSLEPEQNSKIVKRKNGIDASEKEEEEILELKTFDPETLPSLNEHMAEVDGFIKTSLKGSERAKERFRDVIRELNDLGVFS